MSSGISASPVGAKVVILFHGGPCDQFMEEVTDPTPILVRNVLSFSEWPQEARYEVMRICRATGHDHEGPVGEYCYVPTLKDFQKSLQAAHFGKVWR